MKLTAIQERINHKAHVVTPIDTHSTIHASKQALYERMFHAQNYTRYTPNYDETDSELLLAYNVHISITRHSLKQLASKGNMNALELLNNVNHTVSIEDLQQEVLLWFVENSASWFIHYDGQVEFTSDEIVKSLFTCISGYLRRFQTKHYKHQYIEIDGDIVDVNKVTSLADYVSIDKLLEDITLCDFMEKLPDIDKQWLEYRLQCMSNRQIALTMNVTYEKIRAIEKRMRRNWTNNN